MDLSVRVSCGVAGTTTVSFSAPISFPTSHPSPSPKHLVGKKFQVASVAALGVLRDISTALIFRRSKVGFPFSSAGLRICF